MTPAPDSLSAFRPAAFHEAFGPACAHAFLQRVKFIFTPKHGLWLNTARIEFAALLTQGLLARVADLPTLDARYQVWQVARSQLGAPNNWPSTAGEVRIKPSRLYSTAS